MFGRAGRDETPGDPGEPHRSGDWSRYERLDEAVQAYFLHPEVAMEAISGVLTEAPVLGFVLERVVDLTASGASIWQQAAVCDGRRLILWHSEDISDEDTPGETVLEALTQVIPLSAIVDVGLHTLMGHDDHGRTVIRTASLYLATQTVMEMNTVRENDEVAGGRFRQETYQFTKSLPNGGAGQIRRLIQFGRLIATALPSVTERQ